MRAARVPGSTIQLTGKTIGASSITLQYGQQTTEELAKTVGGSAYLTMIKAFAARVGFVV